MPPGFPTHPHRGIETVTYMLEGSVRHRDSIGNIYGFQLWINLPASLKWSKPEYRSITSAEIPTLEKDGATIRIIAGEVDGKQGPVGKIAAQPVYLDLRLAPATEFSYPLPQGHALIVYVFEGSGFFGAEETPVDAVKMLFFSDGEGIQVKTTDSPVRFVLIAGAPFKEPIAPYGPFVMNTREEIMEAFNDLRDGTFIWNKADARFR